MIGEIPTLPAYAVGYGLKGFGKRPTSLRVSVDRVEGDYIWCRTADLRNAGTPLVLDRSQIEWEKDLEA